MDATVFLGRQPIFDRRQTVFGYELLYRSDGERNAFDHGDGDHASRTVIDNSLNALPLAELVGERRAFVNITRRLLVDGTYSVLPRDRTVVELLETVAADEQVLNACRSAKKAGYLLALDDFVLNVESRPLVQYADILKIDFLAADSAQRRRLAERFGGRVMLLAEKVESRADFQEAMDLGYSYFQGYFFCKPEIVSGRDIPDTKRRYMRFIQEIARPQVDLARLEEAVRAEPSLSAKLFGCPPPTGASPRPASIRQAMAMMDEASLRKWASIAALGALAEGKPPELLVTCLARARFCEEICPEMGLGGREADLFLMGLFSAMDALLDQPLSALMPRIPLPADVSAALLGADTALGHAYRLLMAFERANAPLIRAIGRKLNLPGGRAAQLYCEALKWADQSLGA